MTIFPKRLQFLILLFCCTHAGFGADAKPNLIWILADDLGYSELGCYGQKVIQTPNLDRMAREGMRFTQFYAGATVCAPSRSVLMTGQHHGRTRVRGNASAMNLSAQSLSKDDVTVAKVLQQKGYQTALIGKWGLGDREVAEDGLPDRHGFDFFYGYLNQQHAHNHFPHELWRNGTREPLANNLIPFGKTGAGYATEATQYADDLFTDAVLSFVGSHQNRPFFLYWSMVVPHANNERTKALGNGAEVPDYGPYHDKDWPDADKGQAAMVTRMDSYVGRLLDHLKHLGIADKTLVVFTSDNGPHDEAGHDLKRFDPSGPFSGIKRSLTEGGIRVPMIAWWPGKVEAGSVSDHVGYFPDWFSTAADLAGAAAPENLDGLSFVPTLLGEPGKQARHDFLYWEFHEGGFKQAALYQGRWKGFRSGSPDADLKLFDLKNDPAEKKNVAKLHPDITGKIREYLKNARTPSSDWEPKW
jgi:arylsulfatase A-like enzyme